jgi:hypothetical protein
VAGSIDSWRGQTVSSAFEMDYENNYFSYTLMMTSTSDMDMRQLTGQNFIPGLVNWLGKGE